MEARDDENRCLGLKLYEELKYDLKEEVGEF
jgi:hypothetical protein